MVGSRRPNSAPARAARSVGIVGYDGVMALDLVGVLDAFHLARGADGRAAYACRILGVGATPFRTESGLRFLADVPLTRVGAMDTLIVPGGCAIRDTAVQSQVADWIRRHAPRCRRVVSVCTGVYALAASGLLDGRRATTHWQFAADFAERFPAVRLDANALFVRDGRFHTSAGVTAGIDLALALIEDDLGHRAAISVARHLVVHLCRAGGQEQYSEPLRFQAESPQRFGELIAWMHQHLNGDLSVEALAARANLSPRHFARRFKRAYGMTPAIFVERLRLDAGRQRLLSGSRPVGDVATSVGFSSADVFRRAFVRRIGLAPNAYRHRFAGAPAGSG